MGRLARRMWGEREEEWGNQMPLGQHAAMLIIFLFLHCPRYINIYPCPREAKWAQPLEVEMQKVLP